ncbi:hypothetical protein MSAN_01485000 [Mycena sanguinolenta]|uniref:Uncharacterized protein n=1 Tax=Mycena sanguinolenta TaxID=230812 RepID=A0A8H6YC02_9AGAR|nr:hypothetical protein MSAN_01485000 [Mycena sanguinolenta]
MKIFPTSALPLSIHQLCNVGLDGSFRSFQYGSTRYCIHIHGYSLVSVIIAVNSLLAKQIVNQIMQLLFRCEFFHPHPTQFLHDTPRIEWVLSGFCPSATALHICSQIELVLYVPIWGVSKEECQEMSALAYVNNNCSALHSRAH